MKEDSCREEGAGQESSINYWMKIIPPWGRGIIAFMFMFTIWSVFTQFPLGDILNKYADADLKNSEREYELQKMQFSEIKESNEKLDALIVQLDGVSVRLDDQEERLKKQEALAEAIGKQIGSVKSVTNLIAQWICSHEKKSEPDFCQALEVQPRFRY